MQKAMVTLEQAASLFDVSMNSISPVLKEKGIRPVKRKGQWLVRVRDLPEKMTRKLKKKPVVQVAGT